MKRAAYVVLSVMVLLPSSSRAGERRMRIKEMLPPAPAGKAWKLVWHDEFDGRRLDETKWDIPEYKRRDAWWSRKAVSLDGRGNLVIGTFKEGDRYYDACVRTKGKFEHAFGYYVARIMLQGQQGHWSAFWLYNDSVGKVGPGDPAMGGRDGTEIDIMEKPWLDDRVQQTLHWDGYGEAHKSEGKVVHIPGVMKGWHAFGLLWTPEEYVFYVDGRETWRTTDGGVCQVPLYIKLSDEAQLKGWAGDLEKAKLPDRFLTDYVRVYDLVDARASRRAKKPPKKAAARRRSRPQAPPKRVAKKPDEEPSAPPADPEAARLFKEAETLFIEGRLDEAGELFVRMVREYPDSSFAGKARRFLEMLEGTPAAPETPETPE